nr:immunoglobulin light chain junction region [Macaca mulatta]
DYYCYSTYSVGNHWVF